MSRNQSQTCTKPCLIVGHVAEFYFEIAATTLKETTLGQDLEHGRMETENQQDYALLEPHGRPQLIFVERNQN
jgi:hypothetical protein